MTSKLLRYLAAGALGTTLVLATPALAFHSGMRMGGMGFGPHFGSHFAGPIGHAPHFSHFAFHNRPFFSHFAFHNRPFFHHRFRSFAFIGAPLAFAAYDSCWRRLWTQFGPRWVNVCTDYYGY